MIYEYALDEHEQVIARFIASMRQHENRINGMNDQITIKKDSYNNDLNGYGAELAFCIMMNICPDLTYHCRSLGYDCLSPIGSRIDVKNTVYKNGKLLSKNDNPEVDIYALVIGNFPVYKFVGWCYSEELIKDENIIDFGHERNKSCYALTQDHLYDPESFVL